jgi:hypothetical protein
MAKENGWIKEAVASSFLQWLIPTGFWSAIWSGILMTATITGGILEGWSWPTLIVAGIFILACCSVIANALSSWLERSKPKHVASISTALSSKHPIPTIAQVPVKIEFNPENGKFFVQDHRPVSSSGDTNGVYREYFCRVVNDSNESIHNVSCEVEKIVTHQNRPSDRDIDPEDFHEKLAFDITSYSTLCHLAPGQWETLWLFSRLKKPVDDEPIRIVHRSKYFHDRGRERTVFMRFTADEYAPKSFSVKVWVHDGLLRMTWIRPE